MSKLETEMSKDDFISVRNLLRWAQLGAQPANERANEAIEILNGLQTSAVGSTLAPVGEIVEEIRRGMLPSYKSCKLAEGVLSEAFTRQSQMDLLQEADRA